MKLSVFMFLCVPFLSISTQAQECIDLTGEYKVESVKKNCSISKNEISNIFYNREVPIPLSLNNRQRSRENTVLSIFQKSCDSLVVSNEYILKELKELNPDLKRFTPVWDINVIDINSQVQKNSSGNYRIDTKKLSYKGSSTAFSMGHSFGFPTLVRKKIKFSYALNDKNGLQLKSAQKFRGKKVVFECNFLRK